MVTIRSATKNLSPIKRDVCNGVKLGKTVTLSEYRELMETSPVEMPPQSQDGRSAALYQMGQEVNRLEEKALWTA